jgi:hypothetical protein
MNTWVFKSTIWHVLLSENFLNMLSTLGIQILNPTEYKKQPNSKKWIILLVSLQNGFTGFKILIYYII